MGLPAEDITDPELNERPEYLSAWEQAIRTELERQAPEFSTRLAPVLAAKYLIWKMGADRGEPLTKEGLEIRHTLERIEEQLPSLEERTQKLMDHYGL